MLGTSPPIFTFNILLCLTWVSVVSAFNFTNSFAGWVGNSTHTITWDSSNSDPDWYDITLVQPHDIGTVGVEVDSSWPVDWSMNVATHISSNDNHSLEFTLPPGCWPGIYYWVLQADKDKVIPVSTTFLISNGDAAMPTISSTPTIPNDGEPTTISSLVPVTVTQSMVGTSDGHLVTLKPSDVFSSVVVYTTIVVTSKGGHGTHPGRLHMILAVTLTALFLINAPIVVWLFLRYRRRPVQFASPASVLDKPSQPDLEDPPGSATLDLLGQDAPRPSSTPNSPLANVENIRQVWTIINGKKQLVVVPRHTSQPGPPTENPFADPVLRRLDTFPRLEVPESATRSNRFSLSSPTHVNAPFGGNAVTASMASSTTYSWREPSDGTYVDRLSNETRLAEKMTQPNRQRALPESQPFSSEEIAARIFIPGRAMDMGPLGRDRVSGVDEYGLLPPDYSQATQPTIPFQRPLQAGPGAR